MRSFARALGIVVGVLAVGAMPGCGCSHKGGTMDMSSNSLQDLAAASYDIAGTITPSADGGCGTVGDPCDNDVACCSGKCDLTQHVCAIGACRQPGTTCKAANDCCNLDCVNGTCGNQACISDGQACSAGGAACCSTQCVNGTCAALNPSCKTAGNDCAGNSECCSHVCTNGKCAAPPTISYCTQVGDICFHDNECCTGICTIAAGASAGTCAPVNSPCKVDGTICDGCTGCCSSFCAPFGSSATRICQPAGGCHVLGDLCQQDSDCCGGDATNGLPGSGEVKCVRDPNHPSIGTCSQPNVTFCPVPPPTTCHNTCIPEGDVCHYKNNGGCPSNAINNDCCSAPGNKGFCQLDNHGVPRCHGIGACVMPGGDCASSNDCCNGLPCVPGPNGHLVCGSMCVPPGGVCTATTDCCTGYACVVPPGSTMGTCVNPNPPPTVPADMAGSNGGSYDLSTPPPSCSLAGQSCNTGANPCCPNNGTCSSPTGSACAAGETDCICRLPIL